MKNSLVTNFASWSLLALLALVALGPLTPLSAEAQNFVPSARRSQELLARLSLRATQKRNARALMDAARKQAIRSRAEIDISAIDLASELAKDSPSESAVTGLIERMTKLEGEWRRSRILTWLKIRKLLSQKQRSELMRQQDLSGRNIVKTQGEFIDPFEGHRSKGRRQHKDVKNPFDDRPSPARAGKGSAAPAKRPARSRRRR